jgi:hypothetical protein
LCKQHHKLHSFRQKQWNWQLLPIPGVDFFTPHLDVAKAFVVSIHAFSSIRLIETLETMDKNR